MGLLTGTRRALIGGRRSYYNKILSYDPIAYWPLWEAAGTTARCLVNTAQNGTYTGVTLANAAGPDGLPCPFFDGANDYVNVFSTAFRDALNGAAGTSAMWMRVFNAGVWTDGIRREAIRCIDSADATEYFWLAKDAAVGQWCHRRLAGGVLSNFLIASGSPLTWVHCALTWDETANEAKAYVAGVQVGATLPAGIWGAHKINLAVIGASNTTPLNPWHGWLAHCAVFNRALTPAQIADLVVV